DTVNKTGVTIEENHTKPPDTQQPKTQPEESNGQSKPLKKNNTPIHKGQKSKNKTRTSRNSFLYTKWLQVSKELKPLMTLKQKLGSTKLVTGGGGRTLDPG